MKYATHILGLAIVLASITVARAADMPKELIHPDWCTDLNEFNAPYYKCKSGDLGVYKDGFNMIDSECKAVTVKQVAALEWRVTARCKDHGENRDGARPSNLQRGREKLSPWRPAREAAAIDGRLGGVLRGAAVTKLPEVPDDFLSLVKRIVGSAADDDKVELKAGWIRVLLDLAERAPRARRRPKRSLREQSHERLVLQEARTRKAALIAQGMNAELAATQAAEEAQAELPNLAVTTIKDRMERR